MKQFKAAWDRFADDETNLVEFMNAKAAALEFHRIKKAAGRLGPTSELATFRHMPERRSLWCGHMMAGENLKPRFRPFHA